MMNGRPDVSVVIPTHNRKEFLKTSIQSCFRGNDDIDVEVIVVDDGSTDGTRAYLSTLDDPRIRCVFQQNRGAQVARNRGMEHVEGRYTKHLDDDDYLLPESLTTQVQALDESGVACCYGNAVVKFEKTGEERHRDLPPHEDLLVAVSSGGVEQWNLLFLFDSQIATACEWDPSLDHLHIIDYLLKFARHDTRCVAVDEPVAVHRIHHQPRLTSEWEGETAEKCKLGFELYQAVLEDIDVTSAQERALLDAMWQRAHIAAPFDWQLFAASYREIRAHWPTYSPKRSHRILAALDRVLGPYYAEKMVQPVRKLRQVMW
jgi:glycosyltransferase involved in cell wall biosynthesis